MSIVTNYIKPHLFFLACWTLIPTASLAEWSAGGDLSTYYTDNVSLFSATRRLSTDEDPTQPIVDEPKALSGFVYEPQAYIKWLTENRLGEFELALDAGAYIFQDASDYTHGFFQIALMQELNKRTHLSFIYDFVPDQFIGFKEKRPVEHGLTNAEDAKEKLDTHIWSIHLQHEVIEHVLIRGLARYGLRDYEEPFAYRDIQFFTVGSNLEWEVSPAIDLLVAYHYERGYTDRSETKYYSDDIGYINHYASAELVLNVMPKLQVKIIADYEHNDFTSPYAEDIHFNGNENVYQGELELVYQITPDLALNAGWQHGKRKFNYENNWVDNNNLWLGTEFHF